jgi:hypothetical protein
LERSRLDIVELQPLAFQPLLQIDIGADDVVALLACGRIDVFPHDLLHLWRHVLPHASARDEPETVPRVIGKRAVLLHLIKLGVVDERQRILLTVGHLCLQRLVGLAEWQADGRRAKSFEHRDP